MAEEDFDVESLAVYLHLNPDQVRKMANRGKLPGRRINDKWRFSAPEIHLWFEQKIGLSGDSELKEVEKVLDDDANRRSSLKDEVSLAELLQPELIGIPLLARTKSSVIDSMCELAANTGRLWEPLKMKEAIRAREQLHPTALENGVALLHPRRPMPGAMEESFLALGVTSSGLPFGGPRGILTDVFFLICSSSEATHLRILARLSRLIFQPDLLDQIRAADGAGHVQSIIAKAEELLV